MGRQVLVPFVIGACLRTRRPREQQRLSAMCSTRTELARIIIGLVLALLLRWSAQRSHDRQQDNSKETVSRAARIRKQKGECETPIDWHPRF